MVTIGAVVLLLVLAVAMIASSGSGRLNNQCRINLRELCLGFKTWAGDGSYDFPVHLSKEKGHRLEYKEDGSVTAASYFQMITNRIRHTKLLVCPADDRKAAASWAIFTNANLSYFINLEGSEVRPNVILLGDRLLTGDIPLTGNLLEPNGKGTFQWTAKHIGPDRQPAGNISFSDGSVRLLTSAELTKHLTDVDNVNSRFLFPE
jgi:hypothetical protein